MIKRWYPVIDYDVGDNQPAPDMAESQSGGYVTYDDHLAEIARAREERDALRRALQEMIMHPFRHLQESDRAMCTICHRTGAAFTSVDHEPDCAITLAKQALSVGGTGP
jgi:hypothetical protein